MNKNYGMEIVRATEIAALTAARIQGLGNSTEILNQSRDAIEKTLHRLNICGHLVNDRFADYPDVLSLPENIGQGETNTDLMAVALEAHHSAADGKNNATAYAVIAEKGSIQPLPNLAMYKMVVGRQVGPVIDLNQPPIVNVKRVARKLGKYTENVTVSILNQARHNQLIEEVRSSGARIKLIEEGEISGCLSAITGEKSDIFIGYGHAPECSLVAAAIACLGGYIEGKIFFENDRDKAEARALGITNYNKIFRLEDFIRSREVAIAATGVTDGEFLEGVRFTSNGAVTSSFIARAETRTYRKLETTHFFDYKPVF